MNPGVVLNLLVAVLFVLLAFSSRRRLGTHSAAAIVSSVALAVYFGSGSGEGRWREIALGVWAGSLMVFLISYGSTIVRVARLETALLLTAILGIGSSLVVDQQSWVAQGIIRVVVGAAVAILIGRVAFGTWIAWRHGRNQHPG